MGGTSGMGEVSRAPNAPAIEQRGHRLYSPVATVLYIVVGATDIVCHSNFWEMAHNFSVRNFICCI